jgi:hypothetical protein
MTPLLVVTQTQTQDLGRIVSGELAAELNENAGCIVSGLDVSPQWYVYAWGKKICDGVRNCGAECWEFGDGRLEVVRRDEGALAWDGVPGW